MAKNKYQPGHKFSHWTLIELIYKQGWLCRCDCGTERVFKKINYLSSGDIKSCGCKSKEMARKTNMDRYGATHPLQNKKIQAKIKKTNLERYGNISHFKNEEVKEKIKKTNIERYGVENI